MKWLCPIPGGSSPDSVKIKILSKYLLPQFRVREFFSKSKSHSSLSTMQAWFPTGELIHGCGSCPPTSLPTGFPSGGWATFPTLGTFPTHCDFDLCIPDDLQIPAFCIYFFTLLVLSSSTSLVVGPLSTFPFGSLSFIYRFSEIL